MSQEERTTWVSVVVTLLVAVWYGWTVSGMFDPAPVEEIAYRRPLLVAVGAMIVLNIVGAIVLAVGTAIKAEVTGDGSAEEIDRTDERDAHIGARGDRVAFHVVSVLMVGVLAMAMLEMPYFWIANGAFAALVASGLVGAAVKLVAYRRGF